MWVLRLSLGGGQRPCRSLGSEHSNSTFSHIVATTKPDTYAVITQETGWSETTGSVPQRGHISTLALMPLPPPRQQQQQQLLIKGSREFLYNP